ncbi:MAG: ATP-binding protein [Chitinivibrionia bacterium]|nr:ATP-binding protein [Chitinivibrionia bacterium]
MFRRVEALGYRCLQDVSQELEPFNVLVGPNASGKSTFLDVLHFLSDLLNGGLASAVRARTLSISDLFWMGEGRKFEMAVEVGLPEDRRRNGFAKARYEVAIGLDANEEMSILAETLWLAPDDEEPQRAQPDLFPSPPPARESLLVLGHKKTPKGWKAVIKKTIGGETHYYFSETSGWNNPFRLGSQKLGLANLPEDEVRFPVAIWLKRLLMEGVHFLKLNSEAMRRPSQAGSPREFQADGSNLPWVIAELGKSKKRYLRWLAHVRTALPDMKSIDTVVKPEDKSRYLRITYRTGLKAASWALSDGTLRLLALTLLAYSDGASRIFLVEEPENGIHPQAVETVFQSLSSAYGNQILCASHSPVVLSLAKPEQVLCFARSREGATDIVRGSDHPNLRDWHHESDLGTLFATGILG